MTADFLATRAKRIERELNRNVDTVEFPMPFKKVDPEELKQLTEVFRNAGADDPESWARSQLSEGIPQLAKFSFAKALWEGIVDESDDQWIEFQMQLSQKVTETPTAHVGLILRAMLDKGVPREWIVDLVRCMQYEALFHACCLIDGACLPNVPISDWTLHHVDEDGNPIAIIQGLHEILLSMDPTGREMRPRPVERS